MQDKKLENEQMSKKFLQSYLYTEKYGNFFISTAYRRSSASLNPDGWYYETFAWKLENDKKTDWVADNSGSISEDFAITQHLEVIKQLEKNGKFNIS